MMGLALERKKGKGEAVKVGMVEETGNEDDSGGLKSALQIAEMLRHRVRYFTDGAVIGSKVFVNDVFSAARERFTEKRRDGARRMRGNGQAAAGVLWSMRDLRVESGRSQ